MSKIKCLNCDMILESIYMHDFRSCDCENRTYIDGGDKYMRFGCMDITKVLFWNEKMGKFLPYTTIVKEESIEEQKEGVVCSENCGKHCSQK